MLYEIIDQTVWVRVDGPPILPFRPPVSVPYLEREKDGRQNQLFRAWMHMWGRCEIEIQEPADVNYTQQFIGRPSNYCLG